MELIQLKDGTLPFPTLFLTVVWILVVMAGTPAIGQSCNLGDGYHPSSGWPTPSFVSEGEKNHVYLAKAMVVLVFCNVHPNLILILLCV